MHLRISAYLVSLLAFCICEIACFRTERGEPPPRQSSEYLMDIWMPSVTVKSHDEYLCTAKEIVEDEAYIVRFEPRVAAFRVHHMIVFGSKSDHSNFTYPKAWDCRNDPHYKQLSVMYSWAKNAPPLTLPKDVGFKIGKNTSVRYVIIQLHYAYPLRPDETDDSGVTLHITKMPQKYEAGIFALFSDRGVVPPNNPRSYVDINCRFKFEEPLYLFAHRVHTHKLGVVISGYKFSPVDRSWTLLAKGNPHWPQAFYPNNELQMILKGDVIAVRCTYNSTGVNEPKQMGATNDDEMCNFYLMYYTNAERGRTFVDCQDVQDYFLSSQLPLGNDEPLPPNPLLDEKADGSSHILEFFPASQVWTRPQNITVMKKDNIEHSHHQNIEPSTDSTADIAPRSSAFKYSEVTSWPNLNITLGQVTGIDVDSNGNVVVFHRGSHVWDGRSFNSVDAYQQVEDGPINVNTIITLDPTTGHIVHQWGSNLFFLPHGLTIDGNGSIWLTDVALQQVFKFPEKGGTKPLLELGQRFVPGKDKKHFCKPTSVAISSNGQFYVADGYCNSRVIKFSADGKFLSQWGMDQKMNTFPQPPGSFAVVHKVTLAEELGLVCVADRENGRIQCFTTKDEQYSFMISREEFGGRLFSIDYAPLQGGLLYAVCGPSFPPLDKHPVMAFVFNLTTQEMLNSFTTIQGTFAQPHDIAVTRDSESVYVGEIGPNNIWKFVRATHKSSKKVLKTPPKSQWKESPLQTTPVPLQVLNEKRTSASNIVTEAGNFATSMVILALIAIPILILILITVVIRLRKRGKFQQCSLSHVKGWLGGYRTPHSQDKFNIGNLLNPHKGFDRVALDESDIEGEEGSDSDVEEFNATATKKA